MQKKQAEEFIKLLEQVHEEIKKNMEKKQYPAALELLEQCQQGAIELGNLIESTEGEGVITVGLLEGYCELIYQIYQEITLAEYINGNKIYKNLRKELFSIENSIRNDIKVRREVVFLPYKASMWDSLESVWRAANEDENCDAYVIPIPYYDKNPDGSFKELHYEGAEYPKDVPVVWYKNYDFESRQPDAIYIHNPYDECNYVTSVHPDFYSSRLKEFTEQLVYIPYFVLREISPDDKPAIENMKHFCLSPGVLNAHKVIVQSEAMRQIYINVLSENFGEHTRAYWKEKISGLGSPKLDKVARTRREDVDIPAEWLKIIQKPDGSFKKVIFYNTSITALLQHDEKMLNKMQDVFRVFRENQDEVALLWRPHPLIKATIESMRPQLWRQYAELVREYRAAGWGIYDDSSDLNRAIALSDAYYGDGSSVVELCREAGMPVMIQNVNSLSENNYSLAMDNIVEYEGEWWFLAFKDNGIYRMSKETFEAELVVRIPFDKQGTDIIEYGKIYVYNKKIFAFPWGLREIAVYDLEKKELRYIKYPCEKYNRGMVFFDGVIKNNFLYMLPCSYNYILKLDLDEEVVSLIDIEQNTQVLKKRESYAWGSIFVDGTKVFFTKLFENKIIRFDLDTEKTKIYNCSLLEAGGAGICGNEKYVWIIPREATKILCWDREEKTLSVYSDFPKGYQPGNWSFWKAALSGDELFLLPRTANMIVGLDRKNGQMRKIVSVMEIDVCQGNYYSAYMSYSCAWRDKTKKYFISSQKGEVLCMNESGEIENRQIVICDKKDEKCQEVVGEKENRFETLEGFLRICYGINFIFQEEKKNTIGFELFHKVNSWRD